MLHIDVSDVIEARTPRHLGVNVEIQDAPDQSNLWDWLRHARATAVREFHPARVLRREGADEARFTAVADRAAWEAFRARVQRDPANAVVWQDYLFAEDVPWLGVPDEVARWVTDAGATPIISMDYIPVTFSRPLADPEITDRLPPADEWDWAAVASAYEYYVAMVHRYATTCDARYFLMRNECELNGNNHYLPRAIRDLGLGRGEFGALLQREHELGTAYHGAVANQMAILTWAARQAVDDVQAATGRDDLFLISPAWCSDVWQTYWQRAGQWADACDFHHYSSQADTFARRYAVLAHDVHAAGKRVTSTEFGRRSGALTIDQILFAMDNALEVAEVLMTALGMARADSAPCEAATFYHFRFPATHRNYKALLYGDMNLVDWQAGKDTALRSRGDGWYPSADELQVRFATPAYAVFRMLARCVPGERAATGNAVHRLGWGQMWGPEFEGVQAQAVDTGRDLVVNLLNPSDRPVPHTAVHVPAAGGDYRFAVVRETAQARRDEAVAQLPVTDDTAVVDLAPQSLTQVIFTPLALDRATSIRLEEDSLTPGGLDDGLDLWQTTHLRALAMIDDDEIDVSDLNTVWSSSEPEYLHLHQGGLAVRLRAPERPALIDVGMLDDGPATSVECMGEETLAEG